MPTPAPGAESVTLPRRISLWSAVAILVGTTIGSGIFRSPASVANRLPAPLPFLGLWVAGGLLALCGALTLAEVAGEFPDTGGIYIYIREGWGRLPAFLFGWAELVVIRAAALGAVATAFAEYAIRAFGGDPAGISSRNQVHYLAAAAIAATGWLNYRGVRWGTLLQNCLTLIKCGGLLALVFLALTVGHTHAAPAVGATAAVLPVGGMVPVTQLGLASVGLALVSVLWVYDGWADVSFVAGEVEEPVRNLPRVLILGTLLVIATYVIANVAYLTVLPLQQLRRSPLVAADVAVRLVGGWGGAAIGVVVMLSTLGTLNGSMLTGPRVLWAMAHDGLLFRRLAAVHPRYHTPHLAISVASLLGIVFVSFRTFEQLADTFVTAILPFYALAVATVFPLRRRPGYRPRFRTVGYPVTPVLFIVATLSLLLDALADPTARLPTAIVYGVVLAGIPVYRRTSRAVVVRAGRA